MKRGRILWLGLEVDDATVVMALDRPPWSVVRRSPVPKRTISNELVLVALLLLSVLSLVLTLLADDDDDNDDDDNDDDDNDDDASSITAAPERVVGFRLRRFSHNDCDNGRDDRDCGMNDHDGWKSDDRHNS